MPAAREDRQSRSLCRCEVRSQFRGILAGNRLGVFVPPLGLGILAFTASLVFHVLKPLELTEAREYKELVIPLILAFMLVRSCFDHSRSVRERASSAVLVAAVAWIPASVVLVIAFS